MTKKRSSLIVAGTVAGAGAVLVPASPANAHDWSIESPAGVESVTGFHSGGTYEGRVCAYSTQTVTAHFKTTLDGTIVKAVTWDNICFHYGSAADLIERPDDA